MCGIFGIAASRDVVADIYDALLALQHRGQDAAGIMTCELDPYRLHIEKGAGLVRDAFKPHQLQRLRGNLGLGHTRYPTVGGGGVEDAQPVMCQSPFGIALVHNGNVTNYHALKRDLFEQRSRYIATGCDAEVLLNVFACELEARRVRRLEASDIFTAVAQTLERVRGAYSAVALIAGQGIVGFRDPMGIKPMVMGTRAATDGGPDEIAFASESGSLALIGFTNIEPVKPGEAIWIDEERNVTRTRVATNEHRPCIFEHVYFARPDSTIDNMSVYRSRKQHGIELAHAWRETGIEVDVVVPVPDSSCISAQELARTLDVPYREALVKNRYIGRTFIMPGRSDRRKSVRKKLNPIPREFEGKRVLLVDDSIVRGNTSKELVKMARGAGAAKVYMAVSSPPVVHPCVYGIDMSTKEDFIARNNSVEEICKQIDADHLIYLGIDALERGVRADGAPDQQFCTACFTGKYPTDDITPEIFAAWEKDRGDDKALPAPEASGASRE